MRCLTHGSARRNPILTLPPVESKIVRVSLSSAEREFYDALKEKSQAIFEGYVEAGTVSKSWFAIFSLLHRLRMTCDHVALTVRSRVDKSDWRDGTLQGGLPTPTASAASTEAGDKEVSEEVSTFTPGLCHCSFARPHNDCCCCCCCPKVPSRPVGQVPRAAQTQEQCAVGEEL